MSAIGEALGLCVLVGAARSDADEEQLERLRERVPDVMRGRYATEGDAQAVRAVVLEVMGPGWRPSGEWASQLDALGCEWPPAGETQGGPR